MTDQQKFQKQIKGTPCDVSLHGAYADWLVEHDQPEEAAAQRLAMAAADWLVQFAGRQNITVDAMLERAHQLWMADDLELPWPNANLFWGCWEQATGRSRPEPADDSDEYRCAC